MTKPTYALAIVQAHVNALKAAAFTASAINSGQIELGLTLAEMIATHCRPVNDAAKQKRTNAGAALRAILFGADLKSRGSVFGSFPRLTTRGESIEYRQDAVCTTHGVCALD